MSDMSSNSDLLENIICWKKTQALRLDTWNFNSLLIYLCCGLNVCVSPNCIYWNPHHQGDGVRRWSLWELIFVYNVRAQLYCFECGYSVFQHQLLKRLRFTHGMVLASMLNISWPCMWVFVSGTSVLIRWSVYLCLC